MTKITKPASTDSLTELGRTLTDDTLYVHYTCGIVGVCNRRTTKTEWFQNDWESTGDIAKQYEQRGNFIA
jgi:hypothetical protein